MALRTKNAVILAKIEATAGTDAAPVASTDAVLVENPQFNPNPNLVNTDEVSGSLDGAGPMVGGLKATLSFDVYLKGAGAAGTVPEIGKLLRACGFAETINAAAIPVAPEACAAGGSISTAVLGASAAATAQLYRGMPIAISGAVTGNSFIADYTAAKLATLTDTLSAAIVATSNYQIPANVLYSPASNSIPTLTLYLYADGLRYRMVGCRGTWQLKADAGGVGKISFTFSGVVLDKADIAVPVPTYDQTRAPVWINGKMLYNRLVAAVSQLSLDGGLSVVFPDNPNAVQGFDVPEITDRKITGSINPLETLKATRDIFGDFTAGTRRIMHAMLGSTAGNRVGITIPAAHVTNQTPSDRSGISEVTIPFEATGRDAGVFFCFY